MFNQYYSPVNDDEKFAQMLRQQREKMEQIKTDYWNLKHINDKLAIENREYRAQSESLNAELKNMKEFYERKQFDVDDETRRLASETYYKSEELNRYKIQAEEATRSQDLWKHEYEVLKQESENRWSSDEGLLHRLADFEKELEVCKSRELSLQSEISRLKSAENLLAEREYNIRALEGILSGYKNEENDYNQRLQEADSQNKLLVQKISQIEIDNSNTVNMFEKDLDTLKKELLGHCEQVGSQESTIGSSRYSFYNKNIERLSID